MRSTYVFMDLIMQLLDPADKWPPENDSSKDLFVDDK